MEGRWEQIRVATSCSGSDVAILTMGTLRHLFNTMFGVTMGFKHLWSCGSDEAKQGFLMEQFPGVPLFTDLQALTGSTAWNIDIDDDQAIPSADLWICGFSCEGLITMKQIEPQEASHTYCSTKIENK